MNFVLDAQHTLLVIHWLTTTLNHLQFRIAGSDVGGAFASIEIRDN